MLTKFGTAVRQECLCKKRGRSILMMPPPAEPIQKFFADEITDFIHAASPPDLRPVTSSSLRPPWLSASPEICDKIFGKQNKLFLLSGLFTWIVYRECMHSRMLWRHYCPITSNLRPAQLSTKVTPAENFIICLEKNVLFDVWF